MSIYVIADLHLSFSQDKPMDIFGKNWENHAEKIKQDWLANVHNSIFLYHIFLTLCKILNDCFLITVVLLKVDSA